MTLFHAGAEVFDVTVPFRPNVPTRPAYLPNPNVVDVSPEASPWLANHGVQLVDVECLSASPAGDANHQSHMKLLATEVLIIEEIDPSMIESGLHAPGCLPLKLVVNAGVAARVLLVRYP